MGAKAHIKITTLITILLASMYSLTAEGQLWSQQKACPGWNNPANFTAWTNAVYGSGGYSGSGGQKNNYLCPNVNTGVTGTQSLGPAYSAAQMNSVSVSDCRYPSLAIPNQSRQFAIMTNTTGTDPNTGNHLKYVPTQFNFIDTTGLIANTQLTTSIRIGDGCAAGGDYGVSLLNYEMRVTPHNAMMYLYYAIVAQSPTHNHAGNPAFIIRVMRKDNTGTWQQINDTLAYYTTSTSDAFTQSGTQCPGINNVHAETDLNINGWHKVTVSGISSGNSVLYKDWDKVAINLSKYIYDTVRIQALIYDCAAEYHFAYAYIAGECGPAMISTTGCPAGRDTAVTTLVAPSYMKNYVWYASEAGQLPANQEANPSYTWRQLTPSTATPPESQQYYHVSANDFKVTRRLNGSAIGYDTVGNYQTFRCRITSAIDPSKPFLTDFYATVQNTKPSMHIDSLLTCDGQASFWNRSAVPGNPTLAVLDSTKWLFYSNSEGTGTPDATFTGDSIDYTFTGGGNHSLVVRTYTTDSTCWSEALYPITPRMPLENGGIVATNSVMCNAMVTTLSDTITGDGIRRTWYFREPYSSSMALTDSVSGIGDSNRTLQRAFTHTVEPVELHVGGGASYRYVDSRDTTQSHPCVSVIRDTVNVTLLPANTVSTSTTGHTNTECTETNCGQYQWPTTPSACPEVQIKQRHDHTPQALYRQQGWDTAVTCTNNELVLTCTPNLPVQHFNGYYCVEEIPYNPPDTTFYMDGQGTTMNITVDDRFAPSPTSLPFPFYFFGIKKESFVLGDNGMITFNTAAAGNTCPYSWSAPLPWTNSTTGAPSNLNYMRDAIYGVYEDTYASPSTVSYPQGIFYGVMGDYPCRKIIASWNDIPLFGNGNTNNRETYQIVCYEGTNIIEVHVKSKKCCPSVNWRSMIGIQNATGEPQVKSDQPCDANYYVQNGAPAAFWPEGKNVFNTPIETTAYRFSPLGTTDVTEQWYRIFDDGRAPVDLANAAIDANAQSDTNGWFTPMDPTNSSCNNLSMAHVSPTTPSRYVYHLSFLNANNDVYDLYDTITVGVDTMRSFALHAVGTTDTVLNLCEGDTAQMVIEMGAIQDTLHLQWSIQRVAGGTTTNLDPSLLHIGTITNTGAHRTIPVELSTYGLTTSAANSIDSIYIACNTQFTNGCGEGYARMLLRITPTAQTDTMARSCDSFTWRGSNYTTDTVVIHREPSAGGCDSLTVLHLTVRYSSDTVITHSVLENQLPYLWNGTSFNNDTTGVTLTLQNNQDCDSIITFNLTVYRNCDTTVYDTICEGLLPITWNEIPFLLGEINPVTGTIVHQALLQTAEGADSTVTMVLLVLRNSSTTVNDTLVENSLAGYTAPLGFGVSYSRQESDPALVLLADTTLVANSANGCDSIIHFTLHVYRNYAVSDSVTVCDNQFPYIWAGDTIYGDTVATRMFSSVNGTDSVVTLVFMALPTYDTIDTIYICPLQPYIYNGIDYGGPSTFFDTMATIGLCDSIVQISMLPTDTTFRPLPEISLNNEVWLPYDTTLLGCTPSQFSLRDTATVTSRSWSLWNVNGTGDTAVSTDSLFNATIDTSGIYSFRLIAISREGCHDTITNDSVLWLFEPPVASFTTTLDRVSMHEPATTFINQSVPDSCTYLWLFSLSASGGSADSSREINPSYEWALPATPDDYPVSLIAYLLHHGPDTLTIYCTDTTTDTVIIVNTFLQFPNLVTPNGDGINDIWGVVNLLEMGEYSMNELWIYNEWGALVYHVKNIHQQSDFWDPNATSSPEGTYFYRFMAKGMYGTVKQNGTIEVLR